MTIYNHKHEFKAPSEQTNIAIKRHRAELIRKEAARNGISEAQQRDIWNANKLSDELEGQA